MNKRLKKLLTILPLFAAGIATPIALTSCGSTSSIIPDVKTVTFNAKEKITTENGAKKTDNPTTLELDPNINADAQKIAQNTFKNKLNKENLQTDMDKVLSKFFNTYEFESETETPDGEDNELEAEVQKIKVLDVDKELLNATLNVTYKVEENDKEWTENKEVPLKLTPRFATTTEIQSITQMLQNADKNNQESKDPQYELDLGDLIELYIGDKEDNEKSIFEQVGILTKESKYGGLLGYGIKISDLAYKPKNSNLKLKANRITGDETIFAPSAVITDFYVPNSSVTTADGKSITIDYKKVSKYTKEQVLNITKAYEEPTEQEPAPEAGGRSGSSSSKPLTLTGDASKGDLVLNKILVDPIKKKDGVDVSVKIEEDKSNQAGQNFLTVDITFNTKAGAENDSPNITVVRISIDGNWLAPSTPTLPK